MKIILYLFIISFFLILTSCDKGYNIEGSIKVPDGTKVYLVKKGRPTQGKYNDNFDSTTVKSNSFHFSGPIPDPNHYSIELENYRGYLPFFLEAESYCIEMKSDSIWKGSITSNSLDFNLDKSLDSALRPIIIRINKSAKSAENFKKLKDSVNIELSKAANQEAARDRDLTMLEFAKENPYSYISLLRFPLAARSITKDEKIRAFNYLSSDFANHPYYKKIKYELFELDKIISIGEIIPDFKLKNLMNEEILLSKNTNKLMLIDIWASWCGPCIKKFPEIKELASKYPNNLEVVLISIDESNLLWQNAIKKLDIGMFENFLDNNGHVENMLGIKSIPHKLLLDINGVIHSIKPSLNQIDSILNQRVIDQI